MNSSSSSSTDWPTRPTAILGLDVAKATAQGELRLAEGRKVPFSFQNTLRASRSSPGSWVGSSAGASARA